MARAIRVVVVPWVLLGGISCKGPSVSSELPSKVEVETPAMTRTTITIEPDQVTVVTTPVPIWESITAGVVGGLANIFKPSPEQ